MARSIKAIAGTDLTGITEVNLLSSHDTNSSSNLSDNEATIKAVLEKSFLPHQKGDKREHCSMGHRLEQPILRKFTEILQD